MSLAETIFNDLTAQGLPVVACDEADGCIRVTWPGGYAFRSAAGCATARDFASSYEALLWHLRRVPHETPQ